MIDVQVDRSCAVPEHAFVIRYESVAGVARDPVGTVTALIADDDGGAVPGMEDLRAVEIEEPTVIGVVGRGNRGHRSAVEAAHAGNEGVAGESVVSGEEAESSRGLP